MIDFFEERRSCIDSERYVYTDKRTVPKEIAHACVVFKTLAHWQHHHSVAR